MYKLICYEFPTKIIKKKKSENEWIEKELLWRAKEMGMGHLEENPLENLWRIDPNALIDDEDNEPISLLLFVFY